MPDVISDANGKLCVGSYHMWRLLSSPDNYSLFIVLTSQGEWFSFLYHGKVHWTVLWYSYRGKMFVLANIHVLILYVLGARKYI